MSIRGYKCPEPGSLVRVKKTFESDRLVAPSLNRSWRSIFKALPRNAFVIYLGVKQEGYHDAMYFVYSFIHEGIVWDTKRTSKKPKNFLARHIAAV